MTTRQLCTFRVADLWFAVNVLHVQEVLRYQTLTEVPLAPEHIVGLINLRGQIVTAIDMRRRLGLPDADLEEPPMNVVIKTNDHVVALLVDTIGDVVNIDEELFDRPPSTLDEKTQELVEVVCKQERQLLLLLRTDAVSQDLSDAA